MKNKNNRMWEHVNYVIIKISQQYDLQYSTNFLSLYIKIRKILERIKILYVNCAWNRFKLAKKFTERM